MPYTRKELLEAFRTDHPELTKVSDNELFRAIAVDNPDLAKGISELQAPAEKPGGVGAFVSGAISAINPLPAARAIGEDFSQRKAQVQDKIGNINTITDTAAGAATAYDVAKGLLGAQYDQLEKGVQAVREGRHVEALGHFVAGVTPLVGPPAAAAGEKIGAGQTAEGLGEGAGLVGSVFLPKAAAKIKQLPIMPKLLSKLTPAEESAIAFADKAGIPVDTATRSGNQAVKNVQKLLEGSPGGAGPAKTARLAQGEALTTTAEDLAAQAGGATPAAPGVGPVSPETAGEGVTEAIRGRVRRFKAGADEAYSKLREIEARPENAVKQDLSPEEIAGKEKQAFDAMVEQGVDARLKDIVLEHGSGATEMTGKAKTAYTDQVTGERGEIVGRFKGGFKKIFPELSGFSQTPGELVKAIKSGKSDLYKAIRDSVRETVLEQQSGDIQMALRDTDFSTAPGEVGVPMAVDMRPVKEALRPLYDEIAKRMPLAQRDASKGLQALKNLLEDPDFVSASTADGNLSALKAITRQAEAPEFRNLSQGLAAKAQKQLEFAVRAAVTKAGPEAVQALERGRAMTRAKYASIGVLDELPTGEPVQVFNRLTANKDTRINLLRRVAKEAPGELPKVGKAYLEGLFKQAAEGGGFDRADGLFRQWQNLGNESKQILFRNPQLIKDLDDFFLLAKKIAENPNKSGTAPVVQLVPHVGVVVASPVSGTALIVGEYAVAKMLFSPKGSRALMNGLKIPLGDKAAAAAAANTILGLAGEDVTRAPKSRPAPLTPAIAH